MKIFWCQLPVKVSHITCNIDRLGLASHLIGCCPWHDPFPVQSLLFKKVELSPFTMAKLSSTFFCTKSKRKNVIHIFVLLIVKKWGKSPCSHCLGSFDSLIKLWIWKLEKKTGAEVACLCRSHKKKLDSASYVSQFYVNSQWNEAQCSLYYSTNFCFQHRSGTYFLPEMTATGAMY